MGREASVLLPGGEMSLLPGYRISGRDLNAVLETATGASFHACADSICRGYITARGGCRIGLCGTAVIGQRGMEGMRSISSVSVRIPREARGCADGIFSMLSGKRPKSVLIVSPPGWGKTTLLRELVRLFSESGKRVSVVDERSEIAAAWEGVPQFDVGPCTDVLTGAPKAQGTMAVLRAMNPEIIAMDEITAPEDVAACRMASNCGTAILASAHASDTEDLRLRPLYRDMLDAGIFRIAVLIAKNGAGRVYEVVRL